jgi:hypothetical protein
MNGYIIDWREDSFFNFLLVGILSTRIDEGILFFYRIPSSSSRIYEALRI